MFNFTTPIPLSLYIHIPWCVRKCPYCDFNSHEMRAAIPENLYVERLLQDLDENLPLIWGRRLVSIFFGGGTPSIFSPLAIEKILQGVHSRLRFGPDTEITLEANPGTVDEARFADFRSAGVNRLSIGLQSLNDEKLKSLGRIHGRDAALRAISAAKNAGFENFNVDLMHGLPNQSLDEAMTDLTDALQFTPPHLSWYQLTIEPNTVFYRHPPALPPDDTLWEIQEQGKKILSQHNMQQYEVSAYARPGKECAHNVNYWEFGDYLGIGAGAHSKITDFENQRILRFAKMRQPKDYLDRTKSFVVNEQIISQHDTIFEFMLNALRLTNGVPITLFTERTGLSIDILQNAMTEAKAKKLLADNANHLIPTELGRRFLNDLTGMFLVLEK